jgi:glucose-6-phosphate 1-epimerase
MNHVAEPITVSANSGTDAVSVTACTGGGHVTSWVAGGVERFWMSPMSSCGQGGAIRGGVPILFPQFGAFGSLPKHGFARTAIWHRIDATPVAGAAVLALRLHDTAATRAIWPTPFELTLRVVATATWLEMTLTAQNLDDYDAVFTGGLHNYFPINPGATITGLEGRLGWDAVVAPGQPDNLAAVPAQLDPVVERDLIVRDVTAPVVLHDPVLGDLRITATGFPNRVVWNPGTEHGLPDVPAGGASGFVCIEPAVVTPVTLAGRGTWEGSQRLELVANA